MIEVEVKFEVKSPELIRAYLKKLNAREIQVKQQRDVYFEHPLHEFGKKDCALRVRDTNGECTLDYKGPNLDDAKTAKVREEIEVELSSTDAACNLTNLLNQIGFRAVAVVNKTREESSLEFEDADVSVSLDHVSGLGTFVELELLVENNAAIEDATRKLMSLGERMGLKIPIATSYLELLLHNSKDD